MKLYQVKDWNSHFENNKSRERSACSYVCVPNKQHGMGFCRVMAEKDGAAIYGIWIMILGACSQQKERDGWLTSDGHQTGIAWASEDLSIKFRRPEPEIKRALEILSSEKVGWLVCYETHKTTVNIDEINTVPAECPPSARSLSLNRREEKRIEEKRKEWSGIPENLKTEKFQEAWTMWLEHLEQKRKRPTIHAMDLQLKELSEFGEERAIAAIEHSIRKSYQGIFEPSNAKPKPPESNQIQEQIKIKTL